MTRYSLLARLLLIGSLTGGPAAAQPADNGLPPGAGRDLVMTACSQCHGLRTIMAMHDGPEGWRRHVYDMVLRGAQLNAGEAESVITYLGGNFGPAVRQNAEGMQATALPEGPGRDLVVLRCTACHDLQRVAGIKRQRSEWSAIVANMVQRGASATPEEAKTITTYLVSRFGAD